MPSLSSVRDLRIFRYSEELYQFLAASCTGSKKSILAEFARTTGISRPASFRNPD